MKQDEIGWWAGAKKRIYLDFHMPEHGSQAPAGVPVAYQRLDPQRLASAAAEAGADVLVFYAKGNQGNSYFPTAHGHQLGDLAGRDIVGAFVDALRARDVRAVAYFQPIRDRRRWEAHPEWRQINSDGTEKVPQSWLQQGKGGHRLICPLGEAADRIFAELEELVTRYRLDGVWWDRVGDVFGPDDRFPCFCESCRRNFRAHAGFDIPHRPDWESEEWRVFYRWRAAALLSFQQRAHELVRRCGQGACLISNYAFHGMVMADPVPLGFDWEAVAGATDVAALEVQHMRSYLHISSHPMLMRALTDRPVEMIMWNNGHIGDGFVRSLEAAEVAAHTAFARGHAVTLHDTVDHDGLADPRLFEMARHVFRRMDRIAAHVERSRPLSYMALLFSPSTYTWFGRGQPAAYVQEFMGTLRQAIGLHVPLEVISDRHLTRDTLRRFSLIALPMSACLSDPAAAALLSWVEEGGVLFASHAPGTLDADGKPRTSGIIEELFGLRFRGVAILDAGWMKARSACALHAAWGDHPVAFRSSYAEAEPMQGTEVLADVGLPLPGLDTFIHFIAPAAGWGPHPAATRRAVGRGTTVFCAPALGAVDLAYGVTELREPLRLALSCADVPAVRAEAPDCVELIAQRAPDGRLLVHLTNLQGEVGRTHRMSGLPARTVGVGTILPVFDVDIVAVGRIRSARELLSGRELRVEDVGGESRIRLPELRTTASIELAV